MHNNKGFSHTMARTATGVQGTQKSPQQYSIVSAVNVKKIGVASEQR